MEIGQVMLSKKFRITIVILVVLIGLYILGSDNPAKSTIGTGPGNNSDKKLEDCSIYNAVYKPQFKSQDNSFYQVQNDFDFILNVSEPNKEEHGGSFRTVFFNFTAYDKKTGEKISTIRLGDSCSNGLVQCNLSTLEGQFNTNNQKKDLKFGFALRPSALDRDFYGVRYDVAAAPHAFVFTDVGYAIQSMLKKSSSPGYQEDIAEFVQFFTSEKKFPDFSGYDIWVMRECSK